MLISSARNHESSMFSADKCISCTSSTERKNGRKKERKRERKKERKKEKKRERKKKES